MEEVEPLGEEVTPLGEEVTPLGEEAGPTGIEPPTDVIEPVIAETVAENLDAEIKELYQVVSEKIRLSVADQNLTPDSFQAILLKVVESVEEFSSAQVSKLTGTEKRTIATNLTGMIIDDLHEHGQIDDETYGWMKLGLTFLAPVIFQGAKAAWNKLQDIVEDVQEKGCSGCFGRNFCKKRTK